MKIKDFKKITFWTRELRLPLFWLPKIVKDDTLVFYKKSIVHLYHLNNKEEKAAEEGYKYFSNNKNVASYEKKIKKIIQGIREIVVQHKRIQLSKFTDDELRKRFISIIDFLTTYTEIYTKTEEICLLKFEANPNKYEKLTKKLGEMRFALRKEGEPLFYILLGLFLKDIARRYNAKVNDLFFYDYKEIINLFKGKKVNNRFIEERKKGYALILLGEKETLLTGNEFKELFTEVVISTTRTDHIEGKVAMKGKAKGRVRVISHNKKNITKEVARFKKGEILVTEMTRPSTILACRKASAIITDEGGITSHAAIIARELKIPCIISTKIATQILKTGDIVEVDADHGIIRILK